MIILIKESVKVKSNSQLQEISLNLKFLFAFFKKPGLQQLDAFYRTLDLADYSWMAFAVNQRTLKGSLLTKELALSGDSKDAFSWQTAEVKTGHVHCVRSGKKKIFDEQVNDPSQLEKNQEQFNRLLDQLIEFHLNTFKTEFEKSPPSLRQMEAEEKALEWIRVSFDVLKKAIIESLTNPDLLFQTSFFAGLNPKTKKQEIRLITYNLDMTFILLPDHNLRVLIYNKKPHLSAEELKPALMGDYSFRKREILDQLTSLLAVLSHGFHL